MPAPDALRRLGRLPRAAGDVVVALGALVAARRAVRTTRIGALLAVADATAPVAHAVPPLGAREREAAWRWSVAVRRAAACAGGRITCLPRAIALQRLLARHGVHGCRVCIGVRRDGALAAHAWVERGGVVLGEPAAGVRGFALLVTGVTR